MTKVLKTSAEEFYQRMVEHCSIRVFNHWQQNLPAVKTAVEVLAQHNANPCVFVGDSRHFGQFGDELDWAALVALTEEQQVALFGIKWNDEDWQLAQRASWVRSEL